MAGYFKVSDLHMQIRGVKNMFHLWHMVSRIVSINVCLNLNLKVLMGM